MAFDAFMYFPMQASIVGEVQDQAMQAMTLPPECPRL